MSEKSPDPYKTIEIDGDTYKTYGIFKDDLKHAQALYDELLTMYEKIIWQKENGWDILYTPNLYNINTVNNIDETRINKKLEEKNEE